MFRHIVMFAWSEDAPQDARDAGLEKLRDWARVAEEYGTVHVGTDAGLGGDNFDAVVLGDFEDESRYLAYARDERHRSLVSGTIMPLLGTRAALQYQL